ncbi:MAG: putative DNA binding domain-containing protein [Defluviitaleaceae bacterium]|nr:putative DNA binding domain-containing protein [Defluviitaleaceae bacterium]
MEHQQIDWKSKRDKELLKWICGFANAQGGRLEIGKNNNGKVIGLDNAQKMLDDLPNTIKSTMGIIPEINLLFENNLPFIAIDVMQYPNPISYRGKYYFRSGSTLQELTGIALDEFVMRKYGRTWDSAPVPHVNAPDLDIVAFRDFRKKALARNRLAAEDLEITDEQLVDTLKLFDGKYLKRAAILCFHDDPEKWVTGAYVKIGYFKTDDDLVFQDEINGPLITMPDKVVDMLFDKYFKGIISYQGLQRIETYPVNRDAMREAVLNAIVHKDYTSDNPIQIRVYDDKITIFNSSSFPTNWTVEKLLATRTSTPHNPEIARVFFRSGMTEAWGRGIEKIINSNISAGKPKPEFEILGEGSGLRVIFYSDANITINITINETQKQIIRFMKENPKITIKALSEKTRISERNIKSNIKTLKDEGLIDRIGANKNGSWVAKTVVFD